jgi:hypothetical protein
MIKQGITRLDPVTHDWILDQSGWQFQLLGLWIARFGESWRSQYQSTWAVAFGRGVTYYYRPEEHNHGH